MVVSHKSPSIPARATEPEAQEALPLLPDPGAPPPLFDLPLLARYLQTQWRRTFGLNASQVHEKLWVGGEFRPAQWPALQALGVRAVLSMQAEREDSFVGSPPERVLRVPVLDFHAPSLPQLDEAVAFVQHAWRDGLPVLVHCHAGVGRAPLTAAAALVAQGMPLDVALRLLYRQRPVIRVAGIQLARLEEWVGQR